MILNIAAGGAFDWNVKVDSKPFVAKEFIIH